MRRAEDVASPHLGWVTDDKGILETANEITVLVTGRTLESMQHHPAGELFRPCEDLRKSDRHLVALSLWLKRHPGVKREIDGYIQTIDDRRVRVHAVIYYSRAKHPGWVVDAELLDDVDISRLRAMFPSQWANPFERLHFTRWHAEHRDQLLQGLTGGMSQFFESPLHVPVQPSELDRISPDHTGSLDVTPGDIDPKNPSGQTPSSDHPRRRKRRRKQADMTASMAEAQSADQQHEPWLNTIQAGLYLHLHPNTVRDLRRQGKLHPIQVTERNIWYPISELERYVRERQHQSPPPPVMPPPPDPTRRGRGRPPKVR